MGLVSAELLDKEVVGQIQRVVNDILIWTDVRVSFKSQRIDDLCKVVTNGVPTRTLLLNALVHQDRSAAKESQSR